MPCTKKALKLLLSLVNVLFFLVGAALLAIGIWFAVDKIFVSDIIGNSLFAAAAYLTVLCGAVLLVISFIGCAAALRENRLMIGIYFVTLLLLFLLLVIASSIAVAFRGELETAMQNAMKETIIQQYGFNIDTNSDNLKVTRAWDDTQTRLQCCAVENSGWEIYRLSQWYLQQRVPDVEKLHVPGSCCIYNTRLHIYVNQKQCQNWQFGPPNKPDTGAAKNDALLYKGCYTAAKDFILEQTIVLVGVGFGFALLLVLGMVLAVFLYRKIPEREEDVADQK